MSASRSLYVAMAATIKQQVDYAAFHYGWDAVSQLESLTISLCEDLKADNQSFKKDKFLRACGLGHLADN